MSGAEYGQPQLFIGGEWIGSKDRSGEDVLNPANGEALAELPHATTQDVDRAAMAASEAFDGWRRTPALARARIIRKAADLLRERTERIALSLTLEQGKPLAQSRIEVIAAAEILDWCADEGRRTYGRIVPASVPGHQWSVLRQPVGPVAAFTPWNFPLIIPARKIGSALAVGCTMVMKPAEETPVSVNEIARAFEDAGLPDGVLNIVHGIPGEVSEQLINHPAIRKITFTGSTAVGAQLAAMAAKAGVKRCTMELGGHAPVLVCEDADVDLAVKTMMQAKFRNAGQICIAPTRFFVHDRVHDSFADSFTKATQALVTADGMDPKSEMGPLAHDRRVPAVETLVHEAVDQGAKLATGGERIGNAGYFFQPTVLTDVPDNARIMNEEPFGPVATITRVASLDDAITQANRLPFGLASYAFTGSTHTAARLSDEVEAGMLGINNTFISMPETPFGGVKQSGYGSEGGIEGMDPYLVTKTVSVS